MTLRYTSIVVIHGLNFRNKPNHAWETWTLNNILWHRDSPGQPLEGCTPKNIYNSSPILDAAAINLLDHVKNLLHWLSLRRKASAVME